MKLFDFLMALISISSDIEGCCTLLELSRARGDLDKMVPRVKAILRKKHEELGKLLDEVPYTLEDE